MGSVSQGGKCSVLPPSGSVQAAVFVLASATPSHAFAAAAAVTIFHSLTPTPAADIVMFASEMFTFSRSCSCCRCSPWLLCCATCVLASQLPLRHQVEALLPLLCRGIGIHHGGLLPILKEVIEILFQVCSSYQVQLGWIFGVLKQLFYWRVQFTLMV
jgi:hypothetical protein